MAIFVPVALDALYLEQDLAVPGTMMDFSKIPWSDGTREYNNDSPYLSKTLYREPFDDEQYKLRRGLHLHWALPDILTKSVETENGTEFPNVPNRWLIVRMRNNAIDKEWQIESDYLFPEGEGESSGAITMPYQGGENEQPYRYMGRKYPLNASASFGGEEYLENLTAIGWGEPTFAAYYPNSNSVFGFFDKDITSAPTEELQYVVIGYYSDSEKDFYNQFIEEYRTKNTGATIEECFEALENVFGWKINDERNNFPPVDSIYMAALNFSAELDTDLHSASSNTEVTVANKGTEALSAYLSQKIDSNNASMIEEQLEALQMTGQLSTLQLDVLANFKENRHTNGFSGINAGTSWNLEIQIEGVDSANAEASQNAQNIKLPPELVQLQVKANALQYKYEKATYEWQSMQRQLFADWHKYMTASYPPNGLKGIFPPIELVKFFLSEKEMKKLEEHQERTGAGKLRWTTDESGFLKKATVQNEAYRGFAGQTAFALNELIEGVNNYNESSEALENSIILNISPVAAPRFWVPNEPVVCISGPDAVASDRHKIEESLLCYVDGDINTGNLFDEENGRRSVSALMLYRIGIFFVNEPDSIGFKSMTEQPWNPMILEWRASFSPIRNQSNIENESREYSPSFIEDNYILGENEPDLQLIDENAAVISNANFYNGSTVLTPYAGRNMDKMFIQALNDSIMLLYFSDQSIAYDSDYLLNAENLNLVISWYETTQLIEGATAVEKAEDSVYSMLRAYQINIDLPSLSQSLGGFNNALLQLEQVPQLDLAEPIGFASNQEFTAEVCNLVGNQKALAPQPLNNFNPIRSGEMNLLNIRMVDNFGQFIDISTKSLYRTELMNEGNQENNQVSLPPRIIQPGRLNFRFLDATTDEVEMTMHPATSPICGWVLPNHIDASLSFYNQEGKALGYIDPKLRWHAAPASESAVFEIDKIENEHLKRVVTYLLSKDVAFFTLYLEAINSAQNNIDPENYSTVSGLSVYMGQAIAIVRVLLNVELHGHPAVNQNWRDFQQDFNRNYRKTDDFEKVKLKVRIGEHKQLNDGTIGYWIEEGDRFKNDIYYTPESDVGDHELILGHGDSDFNIQLGNIVEDTYLTMLLDPRGKLHATTGLYPVKELEIPPIHYAEAIGNMEMSFLNAPILTTALKTTLPISTQAGYEWWWVEKNGAQWTMTSDLGTPRAEAVFEGSQELKEGWLIMKPKTVEETNNEDETGVEPLGVEQ